MRSLIFLFLVFIIKATSSLRFKRYNTNYDNNNLNQYQPILTNQQQDQQNYQNILSRGYTPEDSSQYTNNIYGYDYRSNPNMPYTLVGNPSQYLPPEQRYEQVGNGNGYGYPYGRFKRQLTNRSGITWSLPVNRTAQDIANSGNVVYGFDPNSWDPYAFRSVS
uniref:Uncharacterized protein n=1 Tax=Acrobeloides nanus TaxID=290746 RepID=A0A914DGT7_9BILA